MTETTYIPVDIIANLMLDVFQRLGVPKEDAPEGSRPQLQSKV